VIKISSIVFLNKLSQQGNALFLSEKKMTEPSIHNNISSTGGDLCHHADLCTELKMEGDDICVIRIGKDWSKSLLNGFFMKELRRTRAVLILFNRYSTR
jgi:hypothetical protein